MNLIQSANLILALLPIITSTVKQVEAMNNTPGNGKAKLDLVLSIVKNIYDATNPADPFDSLVGKLTSIIAALVGFYNQVGTFVKAVKAA